MEWETVIGLEVHAQLCTNSKIFSGAATAYGADPNTQACALDLAMPGTLPVLNQSVVEMAIKFGLAIGAHLNQRSVFERKNYFYPDLPKGYQISQFQTPIVGRGHIKVLIEDAISHTTSEKIIGITRAHLEEDAGKSMHEEYSQQTGLDLNRAGTPLLEIVSEPDLRCAKEAVAYLKTLHTLLRYIEICDGNMQEGSFRCDANVSVRPRGQKEFGTRAEIKNVNSFRFVEKAINYEVERQIAILERGEKVVQETRLYDADKNETRSMRSKEEAQDYRYFPDPDLLPLIVTPADIEKIRAKLPELPEKKYQRLMQDFRLTPYDASNLVMTPALANYFESVVSLMSGANTKLAANWIMGDLSAALNKSNLEINHSPVSPNQIAGLLMRIADNTISGKIAKTVFEVLWQHGGDADHIINAQGLKQVTDTGAIEAIIQQVMDNHPIQLADYRNGKDKLWGFFVGEVMKLSKGKANPQQLNDLLKEKLK